MKLTPHSARMYLLIGVFLIALPSIATLYNGHTGKLLIAGSRAQGTVFQNSVVYITKHNLAFAHGYIINIPLPDGDGHYGGPVGTNDARIYMGRDQIGNIVFSSAKDESLDDLKYLYGYAGWAPFQLDYEMLKGGWSVVDYDQNLVFETPHEQIWGKALEKVLENSAFIDKNVL